MYESIANYSRILYFTILYMEALSIIMYWCIVQVKTSDITCLYMKNNKSKGA
jgi:tRNA uridine 5-carbamoylmethylation protein Kti12